MAINVTGETELVETRGDTVVKFLTFTDENDDPIDISTWVLYFTVKQAKDDTDVDAVITKDIDTHIDGVNGKTKITLTATETYDLLGTYYYDIQYVKPDGVVITIANDKLKFVKDITRRTT